MIYWSESSEEQGMVIACVSLSTSYWGLDSSNGGGQKELGNEQDWEARLGSWL